MAHIANKIGIVVENIRTKINISIQRPFRIKDYTLSDHSFKDFKNSFT